MNAYRVIWQKLPRSERATVGDIVLDVWRVGGVARYSIIDAHGAYLDSGVADSIDAAKAKAEGAL